MLLSDTDMQRKLRPGLSNVTSDSHPLIEWTIVLKEVDNLGKTTKEGRV
jgi:hypothetical protein